MHKKENISYKNFFSEIKKRQNFGKLTSKEFSVFLKKFCGVLIYRGRKSYSIRTFNYLLYNLKKQFNQDPTKLLYIIANKLMPVFVIGQKRYGNNVVDVPVFAYGNKKNFYILNWLVRQLRNKSNIIGIKKQDILKVMIDSVKTRSKNVAVDSKRQHEEILQNIKHNLRRFTYHKKVLRAWRNKTKYLEAQQNEETRLDLSDTEKIAYREGKTYFDFFKGAYLEIIKKKLTKYEKKVYKTRLLNQKYSTYLRKLNKKSRLGTKKRIKFIKYGKRNKKRI